MQTIFFSVLYMFYYENNMTFFLFVALKGMEQIRPEEAAFSNLLLLRGRTTI